MSDSTQAISDLYCFPVQKHGERFVEAPASLYLNFDRPLLTEMSPYLERHHRRIIADVEIGGKPYRTSVYIANDLNDQDYVIADKNGIPPDAVWATELDPAITNRYYNYLYRKLVYSESISPAQASYLENEFMVPSFIDVTEDFDTPEKQTRTWQEVKKISRLVLLGAPGAGKTTCLRKLTLEIVQNQFPSSYSLIPVYFQLRGEQQGDNLFEEVKRDLYRITTSRFEQPQIEPLAQSGQLMLLLDGLDELEDSVRGRAKERILELSTQYPQMRVIVSTRTQGYDWYMPGFTHIELQPFSADNIREWTYQKLYNREDKSWQRFISLLTSERDLSELAKNPLMLSLIVFLYNYNSLLPSSKTNLIGKFIEVLIDLWDSVRGVYRSTKDWSSPPRKLEALCRSAFELRMTGHSSFTKSEFIAWQLDDIDENSNKGLLQALVAHTGLMRWNSEPTGEDLITFSHHTIADYLAARYLVQSTSDAVKVIEDNFNNRDWQRVWEYACGITTDASHLLTMMLQSDKLTQSTKAILAARALPQIANASQDSLVNARDCILTTLEALISTFHLEAVTNDLHEKRPSSWKLKLSRKAQESNLQEYGNEKREIDQLLGALYNARASSAATMLKENLPKSLSPLVEEIFKMLDLDGELKIFHESEADSQYLIIEVKNDKSEIFREK